MLGLFQRKTAIRSPVLMEVSIILQILLLIANHLIQMISSRSLIGPVFSTTCLALLLVGISRMRRWAVVVQLAWLTFALAALGWMWVCGKEGWAAFLVLSAVPALRMLLTIPAVIYWRKMTW